MSDFLCLIKKSSSDATMKKISERMRYRPERSIRNALTVDDISTTVKENSALVLVKSDTFVVT